MAPRLRTLALAALLVASLAAPMVQGLGSYGAVATASTSGIVGVLSPLATANIGFLDNDPADGSVGLNEALVLSIGGASPVTAGDILLDPGTGLTGAAGSTIQTSPGGTLDFTVGATNVRDMLRFVDTLPALASGGPDGVFNPGEPLFFDLDASGTPSSADRVLVSGTGVSGSPGGAVSGTQSEAIWDPGTECIYQGTASTVSVGMKRVSACAPYAAGSNVILGDSDIGATVASIAGLVSSFPATRTATDGATTIGLTTVTTTAAFFVAGDVGAAISGTGIPSGSWIKTFNSATSVVISAAATATGTALTLTVTPTGSRIVTDGVTTLASVTVTSATTAFTADDVGRTISGTGIPSGATITVFNSGTSVDISSAATAAGNPVALTLGSNSGFLLTGQSAWIGSGAVTSGHYRVSATPGTVVDCGSYGSDVECGVATAALSNTKVTMASRAYTFPVGGIKFFDASANGAAVPDGDDRIVLDVDANSRVSLPDVRLNTAGSQTFGSRPTLSAASEVHGYLGLAVAPIFIWLDSTTNVGQVDTTEPLAISVNGDTVLDLGDICLTAVGSCSAGAQRLGSTTQPTTGGTWKNVATATNTGALAYLDPNNNDKFDVGDSLYLHFGAAALPAAAAVGDLLIGADAGSSGTRVTTSPGTLEAFTPAAYRALDVDGSGAFSVGDLLYAERTGGVTGAAEPGDVRLNSGAGVTGFGKIVKEGDADSVSTLLNSGWATAVLFSFRDLDNIPGMSLNDPIFMMPRESACPLVGSDVVLANGVATLTPGSFVGAAANTCTAVATTPTFGYTPTGAFTSSATFYLDMDGDAIVELGDIRMAGITQGGAGTRVGSGGTDQNTALTLMPLAAGDVRFADASGDLIPASLETIILDFDGNLLFTPSDLVVSTGTTTSTGGGGGGGGGGGTTTTTTTSSSSSSTSASSTTTSTTNTTTSTTISTTTTSQAPSAATLNQQLEASLDVSRDGDDNVLTWDDTDGEDGYQVFGSTSPFVLVAKLPAGTTTYRDEGADKDRRYLVTAVVAGAELTADQVNGGQVPGYSSAPEGEPADEPGKKGFIPALSPVLVLGLVAALALLARRRLA